MAKKLKFIHYAYLTSEVTSILALGVIGNDS